MAENRNSHMRWHEIWFYAVTHPTAQGLGALIRRPVASVQTALLWISLSASIGALLTAGLSQLLYPQSLLPSIPFADLIAARALYRVFYVISTWLLTVAIAIAANLLITGMQHGFARLLKGYGLYKELLYLTAAYSSPLLIVTSLFQSVLVQSPNILGVIVIVLVLYQFALMIASIKTVYSFSSGKAWLAGTILPSVVLLVLVFVFVYGMGFLATPDFR